MWKRLTASLAARGPAFFAVGFAVIIAMSGSFLLYLDAGRLRTAAFDEAERQGHFLFSTISQQISDSLYFDDIEQIRKDAESLILRQEITRIAVFTVDGRYLLDTDQYKVPGGSIDPNLLQLVLTHREPLSKLEGDKLQLVGGIGLEVGLLGGLYFEFDLTDRLELTNLAIRERSVWGLLIVLLASGLGFAIASAAGTARSLKAIESNYKELIDQSPLPNAVFTLEGKLRYSNPAFEKLFADSHYLTEADYSLFTDPNLQDDQTLAMLKHGFQKGPVDIPMFRYSEDTQQEDLWLTGVVFPLRNQEGLINEVVVTFQDVTAEKEAEEEQDRFNARLLQSQKLEGLGVMAGGIAHDLNNYLTPIQGYADLLSQNLSVELQPFAENIIRSSARAAELCSQLLAYAGRDTQTKKITNISDEVSEMSELLRTSLSKKATLQQSLASNLPMIMADQTQLRQVLQNLIVNASEALEGEVGQISLRTGLIKVDEGFANSLLPAQPRAPGDYVFIEVADTGIGMTPETVENIFNPFYSTKFTGRGLGLSSVLGIVSHHDGGIAVKSNPDAGTVFSIYFPSVNTVQDDSTDASVQKSGMKSYSGSVLLVDDEDDVLTVGKHILESLGFTVAVARNGVQTLEEFRKNPKAYRLIVLDLMMPVMDGEETLSEIREIDRTIPIIIVTGYSGTDSTNRLSNEPGVTVLAKPYLIADMANVMATLFPA